MILSALQIILLVLIGLSIVSTVLAHVLTWYYFASYDRSYPLKGYEPPVSIIKPTKGVDQSALDNFRSFCEQGYSSPYEIIFCVEERSDPAVPVIRRIIEEYPDRDVRLVFSDPEDTRSVGKLKNMIAGFAASSYDVIIFSDSDARVSPSFLGETVACVENPDIGLGFGAPAYEGSEDWGAALMSISANAFVLRLASVCLFGLFDGAVGTTMVARRGVIEEIGGLEQFGRQVTDDLPIARAIRKRGYRIHLLKQPARIVHRRYGFKRWWSHLHRWLVIIRHYWPTNFWITSLADLSLWWAFFYLALSLLQGGNAYVGVYLVITVLAVSVISAAVINAKLVQDKKLWRFLWVVLIQELFRLPLVIYSRLTNEIVWRGRRLRINPDCTTRLVVKHNADRVKASPGEKIRVFLVNRLFTSIYGMALNEWLGLLRKHRFAIDPPYWPRAAFMTVTASLTSLIRGYENRRYGPKLEDVEVRQPLFILGHWRSGTTHLHNLLALDEQFAYPNVWRALNPHTFLSTERYSRIVGLVSPKTRLIDNMDLGADVPFEDEFATCGTLHSPFFGWVFPRWADHYDRYLTFREVPEEEVARWKAALVVFYKKLTWKYGRPLVLKSPPHTCRIGLLLEMFPDARFVHIHRDPYAVFSSTKRQTRIMERATRLQNPHSLNLDDRIIQRYKVMYDVFFEEQELIPDGQFHEVDFEELERDPVGEVRRIYERLDIPGFEAFRPSLERYVDSISNYRKNEYQEIPPSLRRQIAQAWKRSFEEWGYDYDRAG